MQTLFVIINIIIFLALIYGLIILQKKHVSFSKRVLLALVVGIVFGLGIQFAYGSGSEVIASSMDWFNIVGVGYVKLLQMIVMPLVFISILAAFTKLTLKSNIGKISSLIIAVLIGTTAIAAAVGIGTTLAFNLEALQIEQGDAEVARGEMLESRAGDIASKTFPQQMLDLLPSNVFLDFTGARSTSTIAVVIFAAILGIAYLGVRRKNEEQASMFAKIVDTFYTIIMRVVTLILRLTPFGVLALMTRVTATSDYAAIGKLGKFVIASYVALLIMFGIHLLLIALSGLNPLTYVKKIIPVLTFAFTSRSSAATLPLNIKAQTKELGVSDGVANFAGSFGLSIGQNGCAGIYPAMLAVMIAPTVGQNPLEPGFLFMVILIVAISSFGVAGVGGGATFAAILVLSALDLPIALAGLLISIEPLIDMGRTAVNVSGSMTAGVLTSKATNELNVDVYNSKPSTDFEVEA